MKCTTELKDWLLNWSLLQCLFSVFPLRLGCFLVLNHQKVCLLMPPSAPIQHCIPRVLKQLSGNVKERPTDGQTSGPSFDPASLALFPLFLDHISQGNRYKYVKYLSIGNYLICISERWREEKDLLPTSTAAHMVHTLCLWYSLLTSPPSLSVLSCWLDLISIINLPLLKKKYKKI